MWRSWSRRGLLLLSGILSVFLVYVLVTRSESVTRAVNAPALSRQDAGIDHFSFIQSKAGAMQWQVEAERARMIEAEHQALLENVDVTLYGRAGWELKLRGDEGTIDTSTKNFTLVRRGGDIPVQLQNGYTIYTNHLVWQDNRGEVTTDDPVTLSGNGMEITGRGLIGNLASEEFTIVDDVRVEITQ